MKAKLKALQFKPTYSKRSFLACLSIIFFLSHLTLNAQSISVLAGPSVPFAYYGNNDITKKESGFAKVGFHSSILIEDLRKARLVSPYLQCIYNQNGINESSLENYIQANSTQIKGFDATSPWKQWMLMAGAKLVLYKPGFDLFAKAGIGFGSFNAITTIQYYDTAGLVALRNPAKTNELVLSGGAGTNIYLTSSIALSAGLDVLYARPNYGKVSFSDGFGNIIQVTSTDEIIPVNILQWYFGLRFYIGK